MIKNHLPSRRCEFDPWVGKIPWRRNWQLSPVWQLETATSLSLAWEIPWTEEPGGLQSMGSQNRHNLVTEQQQNHSGRECLLTCYNNLLPSLF